MLVIATIGLAISTAMYVTESAHGPASSGDSSNDLSRELPGLPFATVPRGPDDDTRNAIERF